MHTLRRSLVPVHSARGIMRGVFAPIFSLALTAQLAGAQAAAGTITLRLLVDGAPASGIAVATRNAKVVTDRTGRATFSLRVGQYMFRMTPPGFRPESLSAFVAGTMARDIAMHPLNRPVAQQAPVAQPTPVVQQAPAPVVQQA